MIAYKEAQMSYHDDSSVWSFVLTDAVTPWPPKFTRRARQRDTVAVETNNSEKECSPTGIHDGKPYSSITDHGQSAKSLAGFAG